MHWTYQLTWRDEGDALLDELAETARECDDCEVRTVDLAGDGTVTVRDLCTDHYREYYARYAALEADDHTTTDDWSAVEDRVANALEDTSVAPGAVAVTPGEPLDRSAIGDAAADLDDAVAAISELVATLPVTVPVDGAPAAMAADVDARVADVDGALADSVKAVHDAVPLARAFPGAAGALADPLRDVLVGDAKPQYRLFAGAALGHLGRADPAVVDAHADRIRDVRLDGTTDRQRAWLDGAVAALGAFSGNPVTALDTTTAALRRLADPERFDGASFDTSAQYLGVEALGYVGDDVDVAHCRWLGDLPTTYDGVAVRASTAVDRIVDYPLGHWSPDR